MNLKLSLPEKTGWVFVAPGFDFLALLGVLVFLSGQLSGERYEEVDLRGKAVDGEVGLSERDKRPVVVLVKRAVGGVVYFVDGERVMKNERMVEVVGRCLDEKKSGAVAFHLGERVLARDREEFLKMLKGLSGVRVFEAYRLGGGEG